MAKPLQAGIHGWLILVFLGVLFSPLILLKALAEDLMLLHDVWHNTLTGQISQLQLLYYGTFIDTALFILCIVTLIKFWKSKKSAPGYVIASYCANLAAVGICIALFHLSNPYHSALATTTLDYLYVRFIKALLFCLIWIPYLLKSKRVKLTFVK